jgi:periplasmic protein TonB
VKFLFRNPTLSLAIAFSLAVHGVLLAVRFTAPEAFRFKPTDPGLEVVLVNAKHDRKPIKAQALAQANLDGGGNADKGMATSLLPDSRRNEDGDVVKMSRRVAELEAQQQLLAQMLKKTSLSAPQQKNREASVAQRELEDSDLPESAKEFARNAAIISKRIEDYNKRPLKTQITPSTQEVGYAIYYTEMQKKIEDIGTLDFPRQGGKKLYGELVVYIPIYHDGNIYEKEGGPQVERSSGNAALDKAALRIVRRSAPFSIFPQKMRSKNKGGDVWEVVTTFRFTRDELLEIDLRGSPSQ